MKELRISRCQRTNNLSLRSLSRLPNVLSLTVGWCGRVTFAGLDHFRFMTQLESLTLLECKEFGCERIHKSPAAYRIPDSIFPLLQTH
jgi:hypothetical protein